MAVVKKKKKRIPTIPRAEPQPEVLAPPAKREKVKTSFYLDNRVLLQAKRASRELGVSMNAYITIALSEKQRRDKQGMVLPLGGFNSNEVIHLPPTTRRQSDRLATFLKKHGPGFSLPGEDNDAPSFATWAQIERFAREQRNDLEADWATIGRRCEFDMDVARAADVGQESPAFREYVEVMYG